MEYMLKYLLLMSLIFQGSCASIMVTENQISGSSKLKLKKHTSIKVQYDVAKNIESDISAVMDVETFRKLLKESVESALTKRGVKLENDSINRLSITITEFVPGNGFLRFIGFFGQSYLSAKVELQKKDKRRIFELRKDGQKSGVGASDDQTEENIDYIAEKLAELIVK